MGTKIELKEAQVHHPKSAFARDSHRRIVGIVGDTVLYSNGGDRNYACKRVSFLAWRAPKAVTA